ncbi:PAS domain S-box protein [Sodalinema gerasimenkoae]|uniref:PAS domain S-box protein n=1 Tax=Sodalinema gerasimenkoae TaxID=2862348 RepID=UPI00135CC51E|nr:PAS domain S-box protein [Sodalinema gerasimenkoae]
MSLIAEPGDTQRSANGTRSSIPLTSDDSSHCTWGELIARSALRIRQSLQLNEILQTTVDEVQGLLRCDRVLFYQIHDQQRGKVVVEAVSAPTWSLQDRVIEDLCFYRRDITPDYHSLRAIADINHSDLDPCYLAFLRHIQVKATLVSPLFQEGQIWGVLAAHHCRATRPWSPSEIDGFQQITIHSEIAISHANLLLELETTKDKLEAEVSAKNITLNTINEQLKQQNKALEHAVEGIAYLNPQGYYQMVNPAYARISGCEPQQLLGQSWHPTVYPEDIPMVTACYEEMLQRGKVEIEVRGLRCDGSVFYKNLNLVADYDAEVGFVGYYCFVKDITERQGARLRLQSKTEELDRFFSVALDLLCIANTRGEFIRLNHQWEKTLGYPLEHLEGQSCLEYVHPEDLAKTQIQLSQLANQKQILNFVNRYRCQDGSYRSLEWRSVAVGDLIYSAARDITETLDYQTQLEALSTRLNLALDAGQIGTWDWTLGDVAHWDQRMYDLLGVPNLGRNPCYDDWNALIDPEDRTRFEVTMNAALQQGTPIDFEFRIRRPNGEQRWLREAALIQRDAEGTPIRMTGIDYDITDRKRAELALQESEAKYRTVIETTLEGVWVLDAQNNTRFVNQQLATMLGYPIEDLLGTPFEAYLLQEAEASSQCHLSGISQQRRAALSRQDGTPLWVLMSSTAQFDCQGEYDGCIQLLSDITPMVEIEANLRQSESQLSGVLNSSLDGIMAFRALRDAQETIIDFIWLLSNPQAGKLVGRSPEELVGKRLLDEMPGNKTDGLFDAYVQVVESAEPFVREFYYQHEGIDCWFETIAVKLGDGFTVTFRDITQAKRSEQALQQANQELEQHLTDLKERHQEMLILSQINEFLQACLTVEEVYQTLSYLIAPLFPHCGGALFQINPSSSWMKKVAQWGDAIKSQEQFQVEDCWALRRGRPYVLHWQNPSPRCRHLHHAENLAVSVCIPIMAQGETFGLFYLESQTESVLREVKQQLAQTLCEQLGLAIANLNLRETLHHQSIRDPLTGLFNRRYLQENFEQAIARSQRNQEPIGVILLDIDHFKQFNDTYGHEFGDQVLQRMSELLTRHCRACDIPCRYGGEEMMLLLPGCPLDMTLDRAEALRVAITQEALYYQGQAIGSISASFGVAVFPQQGTTASAVIQNADAALYRAKAAGRNCVMAPSAESPPQKTPPLA